MLAVQYYKRMYVLHSQIKFFLINFTISDVSYSLLSFGRCFLQEMGNAGYCYV